MTTQHSPNVILVLTDDQGYGDLACHGNPHIKTPNLDAFHEESLRLTDFHVGPTCAPTRSGLYTGHYANSTGVWHTVGGRSLLRGNETTIAHVFRENGYRTALFGKWHLGDNYPYRPQDRGFETVLTHGGGGLSQMPDYWGNDYFDDTYYYNGEPKAFKGYCTDVWFGEAQKYITEHKDEPFLCFITPNAPHSPYNVDSTYSGLYDGIIEDEDRRNFYGMISNVDENFGRLRDTLSDLGIADNTILLFMTDNGSSCGSPQFYSAGLRGAKASEYDGGHRVPFFLHWKDGNLLPPRDIDTLTGFVDFMPTLMDLCGIDLERYASCNFHGTSLKPLLTEATPTWPSRTLVTDSQRLPYPVKWRKSAVMTQDWRLINGTELYDMNKDRGQENDISETHPDVVKTLRSDYESWWDIVSCQFEEPIPISIGAEHEPEACLRAHDWRPEDYVRHDNPFAKEDNAYVVWMQGQIRRGAGKQGYFELMVEKPGTYRFSLRRWPAEENRPVRMGMDEGETGHATTNFRRDVISTKNHTQYEGGVALDITAGSVEVTTADGKRITGSSEIAEDDTAAVIRLTLPAGPATMTSLFTGPDGFQKGVYYTYAAFEGEENSI